MSCVEYVNESSGCVDNAVHFGAAVCLTLSGHVEDSWLCLRGAAIGRHGRGGGDEDEGLARFDFASRQIHELCVRLLQ